MNNKQWKDEFEQQFGDMPLWRLKGEKLEVYGRLVNFIESLLAEQKKELLDLVEKEVEKLETNGSETFADGHMQCKSEVSTIINNLRV